MLMKAQRGAVSPVGGNFTFQRRSLKKDRGQTDRAFHVFFAMVGARAKEGNSESLRGEWRAQEKPGKQVFHYRGEP